MEEYIVVNAQNLRSLEAIVTLKLREGWELAGSLVEQRREEPLSNSLVWRIDQETQSLKADETGIKSISNWCQPMIRTGKD